MNMRVGLTPTAVREYVRHGHQVLVETGLARVLAPPDDVYEAAGASIAPDAAAVFARAGMIVKVKEPQPPEWPCCASAQIAVHLPPSRCRPRADRSADPVSAARRSPTRP